MIGNNTRAAAELMPRLVQGGHELANHLMADRPAWRMTPAAFEADLLACDAILQDYGTPRHFRPPSGIYRPWMPQIAARHGYRTVLGDAFPLDTHLPWQAARRWLLRHLVRPGSIIILHDRHTRGRRTAETLDWLLPWLAEQELQGVRLSDLLPSPPHSPRQGP